MELLLTILDYASYVVAVGALISILVILMRKFRVLSSINTGAIPKHQQEEVRKKLAAERLQRKFEKAGGIFQRIIRPIIATSFAWVKNKLQKLVRLERKLSIKVAKKDSHAKEKTDAKIEQLSEQAEEAEEEEDYVEAEQKYIEMISLNPTSIKAYKDLGDLYMEIKDYKSAEETYRHIIGLLNQQMKKPENGETLPDGGVIAEHHADIAEANIGLEKWKEAQECIDKSLQLAPNNPKYLDLLFQISMKREDYDRADKALTKLKEVNPENKKLEDFIDQLARAGK